MIKIPRVTLEQWAALQAVVDEGSFAQAAEALNKSQSSISYALKGMQEQLPVELLRLQGRKAELTAAGETLLRRARTLLEDAHKLETLAATLSQGWEPEVKLAVELIFPPELLLEALAEFAPESGACKRKTHPRHELTGLPGILSDPANLVLISRKARLRYFGALGILAAAPAKDIGGVGMTGVAAIPAPSYPPP